MSRLRAHECRELPRRDFPGELAPMLATLVDEPFDDEGWYFERKLDGERVLAHVSPHGKVDLRSRSGERRNDSYPELVDAFAGCGVRGFVADGEVVAFEGATTSFSRLQARMRITDPGEARASGVAVKFYLFDLLQLGGRALEELPLHRRKQLLRELLPWDDPLRWTPHRRGDGRGFLREACGKGWEGILAKDAGSPYVHARSRKWQKLRCSARQELVVVGFTEPQGERAGLGALLVGYHEDGRLHYAGRVGTGFDEEELERLRGRLDGIEREDCPLDEGEEDASGDGVHWVRPELVAEVAFTEWTHRGRLRHPRYLGLRRDKDPAEVGRERPAEGHDG